MHYSVVVAQALALGILYTSLGLTWSETKEPVLVFNMRQYHLTNVYDRLNGETSWLLAEFASAMVILNLTPSNRAARLSAEMSVIRLQDCWARFSRELIVLSAGGKPITANGLQVSLAPGVKNVPTVIPELLKTYEKRKEEPNWAVSYDSIDAAKRLKISNFSTVSAALGAINSPAEQVRPVRNFFAHRGRRSATKLRKSLGSAYVGRLTVEGVAGAYVRGGVSQFEKWVNDMRAVALAAIQ